MDVQCAVELACVSGLQEEQFYFWKGNSVLSSLSLAVGSLFKGL